MRAKPKSKNRVKVAATSDDGQPLLEWEMSQKQFCRMFLDQTRRKLAKLKY